METIGTAEQTALTGVERGVIKGLRWVGMQGGCEIFVNTGYEKNRTLPAWGEADWARMREYDAVYVAVRKISQGQAAGVWRKFAIWGIGPDVPSAVAAARKRHYESEYTELYDATVTAVLARKK